MARVNFLTLERTKPAQTPVAGRYRGSRRGPLTFQISALEVRVHANTHLHGLRRVTLSRLSGYCLRGLPGKDTIEARDRLEENG